MINRRHLIASGAALAVAGCGRTERALNSADAHASDYPTVQGVQAMADMIAERSGGRLSMKIFAGGQLGSERDTLELTVFGALDLNRVNLAPLNSIASETVVPALPFCSTRSAICAGRWTEPRARPSWTRWNRTAWSACASMTAARAVSTIRAARSWNRPTCRV